MAQKKKKNQIDPQLLFLLKLLGSLILILVILMAGSTAVKFCMGLFMQGDYIVDLPGSTSPVLYRQPVQQSQAAVPAATQPGAITETARATILATGDLMAHMPINTSANVQGGGSVEYMFSNVAKQISAADYAVVNLETTLAGTENGRAYSGSPYFNTPDAMADGAKAAGFDLLLTGNNHCIDNGTFGLKRTLDILKNRGLDTLGTTSTPEEPGYIIKDIGGIQVGMLCYTNGKLNGDSGQPTLNGLTADQNAAGLISVFDYRKLDSFYKEVGGRIEAMKQAGAEVIVIFLHWGNDYSTQLDEYQPVIAQKLCDLGVDVISGSHPHSVEPLVRLTSTADPRHTTLCLYSAGTFLSNLRADNISMTGGHSEDSVLFSLTFAKYSNGKIYLDSIRLLPTWVLLRGSGDNRYYSVLPLDYEAGDWKTMFSLSDDEVAAAKASYNRTMDQLGSGHIEIETAVKAETEARLEAFAQGMEPN